VDFVPRPDTRHLVEYKVLLRSDGSVLGHIHRRIFRPNVNYKGTRIRKIFKGSPKWFAEVPGRVDGLRFHRMDQATRWQAVRLLLRSFFKEG